MKEKIKEEQKISPAEQPPWSPQYFKESPNYPKFQEVLDNLKNSIDLREGLVQVLAKERKAGNTKEAGELAEQILNLGNEILGLSHKLNHLVEGETNILEYLRDDVSEHMEH